MQREGCDRTLYRPCEDGNPLRNTETSCREDCEQREAELHRSDESNSHRLWGSVGIQLCGV